VSYSKSKAILLVFLCLFFLTTQVSAQTGTTPPVVSTLVPADNATNVSTDISGTQDLQVSFNEQVNSGAGNISIYKTSDNSLVEAINVTNAGRVSFFLNSPTEGGFFVDLQAALEDSTEYYVQIDPGAVVDNSLNSFAGITDTTSWSFTTGDETAPTVTTLDPADDETNVALDANLVMQFDEGIAAGGGDIELYSGGTAEIPNSLTYDTDQTTPGFTGFDGNIAFYDSGNTNFEVVTTADVAGEESVTIVVDLASTLGNDGTLFQVQYRLDDGAYQNAMGFSGTVGGVFELDGFGIQLSSAAQTFVSASIDVTGNTIIDVRLRYNFNNGGNIGVGDLQVTSTGTGALVETFNSTAIGNGISGNTLTLNPTTDFAEETNYYVLVANNAIQDDAASPNNFAGLIEGEWNFTTGDFTAPTILTLDPADDSTNVSTLTDVTAVFDEPIAFATGQVQVRRVSDDGIAASFNLNGNVTTNNITLSETNLPNDTLTVNWTPQLEDETDYYIYMTAGSVTDDSANANPFAGILDKTTWNFQTGDITEPQIVSLTPPDDDNNADPSASFVAEFDETVQAGTGNITLYSGSQVRALEETFNDTSNLTTASVDSFYSNGSNSYFGINFGAGDGSGNWGGDSDPTSLTTYTGFDGNYFDASALDPNLIELDWENIDITNLTNLAFSADFAAPQGWGQDDYIRVQVAIDGGGFTELLEIRGDGDNNAREVVTGDGGVTLSETARRFHIPINGTGTTLDLNFEVRVSAGGERVAFDNVVISGIANTPTQIEQVAIGDASVTISGNTLTYDPTATLNDLVEYFIIIDDGAITDDATNPNTTNDLTASSAWNFATGDYTTAPILVSLDPPDDSTNVSTTPILSITLNENVQAGTGNIEIKRVSDNGTAVTFDVTSAVMFNAATAEFTVSSALNDNTEYYVSIPSGAITNGNGNAFAGFTDNATWNFTTGEFTGPQVVNLTPLDDATDVAIDQNLIIQFDKIVTAGTGSITIHLNSDDSVVETIAIDAANVTIVDETVTINPLNSLLEQTEYYVQIAGGVITDTSANTNAFAGITDKTSWSFTTADSDGLDPGTENQAPNGGDGNNDGIPDRQQANVASFPSLVDGYFLTLAVPEGILIANPQAVAVPNDAPADVFYPCGMLKFELTGLEDAQVMVDVFVFQENIDIDTYFKFNQQDQLWENIAEEISSMNGSTRIRFTLVDGGAYDADGNADGTISDPGGPGIMQNRVIPGAPTSIPSLQVWGLLVLIAAMAAALGVRRRQL